MLFIADLWTLSDCSQLDDIILHYLTNRSFHSCIMRYFEAWMAVVSMKRVSGVRHRMAIESVYARKCIVRQPISATRDIYYPHLSHSMCLRLAEWNERNLIGLSGDLTSSCTVMSVKLLLQSRRRSCMLPRGKFSIRKCENVRNNRVEFYKFWTFLWQFLITYVYKIFLLNYYLTTIDYF